MSNNMELPIDKYKNEILQLIQSHQVTIISSSTGSGKTTRVPRMIFEEFFFNSEFGLFGPEKLFIAVTQPRRIATTKTAKRVAEELQTELGDGLVGYLISLDNQTTTTTPITYMTTGTLVQMFSQAKRNHLKYTHIVLDEVHGRDIYTDMLLLQIKLKQKECKDWNTKIILLSATMNMEKLAKYFDHTTVGRLEIPSFEKTHQISVFYIDDLLNGTPEGVKLTGLYNPDPEKDSNNPNYEQIPYLLCQLTKFENAAHGINSKGAVLIFLPGIGEISTLGDKLKSFSDKNFHDWVVKLMHSNITDDEQNSLFPSVLPNQRKIILATNIAESSITVKDVRYVIDFCLTRYMKYDITTTFSGLVTDLSSRHQSVQRAGRAGRTGPGFCFRLVEKNFFDNQMNEESLPEMQHCGLGLVFLHLKKLNMGSPAHLLTYAIDPPDTGLIKSSILSLKECGALTIYMANGMYDPTNGELTTIGLLACNLACDPRQARFIAFGRVFGLLNEAIIMAMSISSKSVFASFVGSQMKKGIEAWIKKMNIGGALGSDAMANLGAYQLYKSSRENGDENWMQVMKENYIRSATMRNVAFTIDRVHRKLSTYFKICVPEFMYCLEEIQNNPEILFKFRLLIAFASYPNIFFRPLQMNHDNYKGLIQKELLGHCPKQSLIIQPEFLLNGEPTQKQEQELFTAIWNQHQQPDGYPPEFAMRWNDEKKFYVLTFFPVLSLQEDWVGNVAKDVYRALKFKGMNQFYTWTTNMQGRGDGVQTKMMGPRSPISMKFKCQFEGKFKSDIDVDRESVNLYNLDTVFPAPSKYLLTSLQMAQKKNLIAKDSTLIPLNNGLFTWLHLLLTPSIQFTKATNGRDAFFGGIAGLGNNVFSNHNSKIQFDVNVSRKEISIINHFRKELSQLVEYPNFVKSDSESMRDRNLWMERFIIFMNNPSEFHITNNTFHHAMNHMRYLGFKSIRNDMFPTISTD